MKPMIPTIGTSHSTADNALRARDVGPRLPYKFNTARGVHIYASHFRIAALIASGRSIVLICPASSIGITSLPDTNSAIS